MNTFAPFEIGRGSDQSIDHALVTAFLENVPDFVFFKDRESRFIAVSKSKVRRNGLTHEVEIIGKSDFDFFSEKNARQARQDEEEIMRTGVPMLDKLEHVHWVDGRETWALMNKMPLRDGNGVIIGTFGITKDVTETKKTEQALERTRKELIDASRRAGMAEVATGVLHNVGNVLNSVNVSASVITNGLKQSKVDILEKVAALLREHASDLANFLMHDPKGQRVPALLDSLALHGVTERDRLLQELDSLHKNIDHIKEIVSMQQAYATMVGVVEPLDAVTLMEDSLCMNAGALARHEVTVVRDFQPVALVLAEKAKVLQILVNLIRNAKHACDDTPNPKKEITLRLAPGGPGRVHLMVQDTGVGIPSENLTRIFAHGFTTRTTGHGFGLHSSANAAKEMKGALTVCSGGCGQGATFTLDLPAAPDASIAD